MSSQINSVFYRVSKPFLLLLLLLFSTGLDAVRDCSAQFRLNGGFKVVGAGDNYTILEFILPDLEVVESVVEGQTYLRYLHPEAGLIMHIGKPEVLTFSTAVSLPSRGVATIAMVESLEEETIEDVALFPSQGFNLEVCGKSGFKKDTDFYGENVRYPEEQVLIGEPAIMRDVRIAALTVHPFTYNPQTRQLTITNRLRVKIVYEDNQEGENEIINQRSTISRSFEPLYRNVIINYEQFARSNVDYQMRSILIVHHHTEDNQYQRLISRFANWKRDKGFKVSKLSTADRNNTGQIKSYIQEAYNSWDNPPEYIILVGGKSGPISMPVWTIYDSDAYIPGHSDGDHDYTTLEGNDILPDAFVGRISVGSVEQLATSINKIFNYERTPYFEPGNNWYNHNLLTGDPGVSGISTIITNKYIKELMLIHNDDKTFAEVYTQPFATQMQNAVNQGVSFFSFRGLENLAGWASPSDEDLYNGYKMPHATLITCRTLDFDGGKQVGRLFRMGTPVTPKGIITGIGLSWVTETAFNNCFTGGIYNGIFTGGQRTIGEALMSGKLNQWITYKNSHAWQLPRYFHLNNMIGDPSLDIWVGEPQQINVSYPEQLPPGSNSILIEVTDAEQRPVQDAWVTIRTEDDELFSTGYTCAEGLITHFFDSGSRDEVNLTVTKPEHIPHIGQFEIAGDPIVAHRRTFPIGYPDAGTQFEFDLSVANHSNNDYPNAVGSITIDSEFIGTIDDESGFGNIDAGRQANSEERYSVDIAPETPDGYKALFLLTVTSEQQEIGVSRFSIDIHSGKLVPVDVSIENDDEVLQPGQEAVLRFSVRNTGELSLHHIVAEISGGGHGLTFANATNHYGTIAPNQQSSGSPDNPFLLRAEDFVIPGASFNLQIEFTNPEGFEQTLTFDLTVGTPEITDPFGPDNHGYWCYDVGDLEYELAPAYDWIEIAPQYGGEGVNTGLNSDFDNMQTNIVMELPFRFRFYGVEYDVITICANGWISFGETEQTTQRNWKLPGPLGPSPIVAAFWDNLSLSEGGVYTKYDEINSKFIIQWQNARNVIRNAEETFQIILYDPVFHHTATGDGPIKLQYKVFNNLNNGANTPVGIGNWGNYATVGIADHTGTDGLEYTFNNTYPVAAKPIEDEAALYFTTGSVTYVPYVVLESFSYQGENFDLAMFGDSGDIGITLMNVGGQDANHVSASLSSDDPYVDIIRDKAELGDIPIGSNASLQGAFTLRFATDIPNKHEVFFRLSVSEGDQSVRVFRFMLEVHAPDISLSSFTPVITPVVEAAVPLDMTLVNKGLGGSCDVRGRLATDDIYVTVLDDYSMFGSIAYGDSVTVNNAYTIEISNDVPDGHRAEYRLALTSEGGQHWEQLFHIELYAPYLTSTNPIICDSAPGGNNNGVLDPGETVTIHLPVVNRGRADARKVSVTIDTSCDMVTINSITPDTLYIVPHGEILYTAVDVTICEEIGEEVPINFNYRYETGEYEFTGAFVIGTSGCLPAHIGEGAAQTSRQTASPINIYYQSLRSQAVYTVTELNDAGIMTSGYVNGIGYYVTGVPEYPLPDFTIKVTHSSANDASSHIDGDLSIAYNAESFQPEGTGWAMIEFDSPFYWNGEDNILIDTAFSPIAGWSNSGQIRVYHQENGFRYAREDNIDQRNVKTNSISTDKPQLMVNFGVDRKAISQRPRNLNADYNRYQVNLTWSPPDNGNRQKELANYRATRTDNKDRRTNLTYNIYCNGVKINDEPVTDLEFVDSSFNPRRTNFYTVTTLADMYESAPSNIVKVEFDVVAKPVISPKSLINYDSVIIEIDSETDAAEIYYTLDGSRPTQWGDRYEEPFELFETAKVTAIAFKDDWLSSDAAERDYLLLYPPQNVRTSGSLSTAHLYWDEPDKSTDRGIYSTGLRSQHQPIRGAEELDRSSAQVNMLGYFVYLCLGEDNHILLTPKPLTETKYKDKNLEEGVYRYFIRAIYDRGFSLPTDTVQVQVGSTSVEDQIEVAPYVTELGRAFPNPFNPETNIEFTLSKEQQVTLDLYNIRGQFIKSLINDVLEVGRYQVIWNGTNIHGNRVGSGVYLYRMQAGSYSETKKVIMIK